MAIFPCVNIMYSYTREHIHTYKHTNTTNLSLEVVRKMLQLEQLVPRLWHFHHFLRYYLSLLIRFVALSVRQMILLPGKTLLQQKIKRIQHSYIYIYTDIFVCFFLSPIFFFFSSVRLETNLCLDLPIKLMSA